jgi:mRNA-degrading endonuclease RelE of RelBE toxin-antitoxin system
MDVLIDSTKTFEKDLEKLSPEKKAITIQKINDCATLFYSSNAHAYRKLRTIPLLSGLNGYESSLYTLRVAENLRVILTVDEDPIFKQTIFTLFRVVKLSELGMSYNRIAESIYREIMHQHQEVARLS